jgi:hypothetical protein
MYLLRHAASAVPNFHVPALPVFMLFPHTFVQDRDGRCAVDRSLSSGDGVVLLIMRHIINLVS